MHESLTARCRTATKRAVAVGAAAAAVAAFSLAGLTPPATAAGFTWYVDQNAGTDAEGCGEAAGPAACATITETLELAAADDIIAIAPGNYAETLVVTTPVTFQGAGASAVTLTGSTADEPTILIDSDGLVSIADVTVRPAASATAAFGPAVQVAENRSAELDRVTVIGPEGARGGVGVAGSGGSTVVIRDSSFSGFSAGVAIGLNAAGEPSSDATLTMSSSTLTGNDAGVTALWSDVTITGGSIAESFGAGIIGYGSEIEVTGTSISGNGVPEAGTFRGGVVLYNGGTFTGTGVTLSGNDRAGVMLDGADLTLTNSTVTDNTGTEQGYGIFARPGDLGGGELDPATVSITGTTVSGHTTGLDLDTAQTEINNSVISGNRTGITTQSSSGRGSLELIDSLVTGNGIDMPAETSPAGVLIEGPTDVVVTDTEISNNPLGILAGPDSRLTITDGTVSDNSWAGILAIEQPGSGTVLTVDLTRTSILRNGLDAPQEAIFGLGGIAARFQARVTGVDITITGNAAGVMMQGGTLSLTDSTVSDNVITSLEDELGGLPITGNGILAVSAGESWQPDIELVRTEVSGNARMGLFTSPDTSLRVLTSTVVGNGGAGISNDGLVDAPSGPEALLLAGSTVAQNAEGALRLGDGATATVIASILQAPEGVDVCAGETSNLTDGGVNVVSDDTCAPGVTTVVGDPVLEGLADNGGPTLTALPGPTSPAVNLVPVGTSLPWGQTTIDLCPGDVDQRGLPRLVHDACDAGAVERAGGVVTVTASDATTYEGAFEPEITASYTGFLDGDTAADLDTLPTCSYDLDAATTSCSGGADDFYSFEYVDGTLTVLDPLVIVTESLPAGTVGQEYSVTLEATGGDGGPYTWGMSEGSLPAGLQLDTATGEITGIPEVAGEVTFTVFVGDPITKEFTIDVEAAPGEPTDPPTTSEPTGTDPTDQPTDAAPSPTAGSGGSDEELPDTGSDGLTALAISAAITLLGGAVLLIARRHRQQHTL